MILYKLKKLLRESGSDLFITMGAVSIIFACCPIIFIGFIFLEMKNEKISKKIILLFITLFLMSLNTITLFYVGNIHYNILVKFLLSKTIDISIYFPIVFGIGIIEAYKEIKLSMDEKRDCVIENVLNKFKI